MTKLKLPGWFTKLLWAEFLSPHNLYVEILTPSTSECDLAGRKGFREAIKLQ